MKSLIFLFCLTTELLFAQSSWVKIGEMPRPIYGGQAVAIDTVIYIIGGIDEQLPGNLPNNYSDSIRIYYPQSNTWGNSIKMVVPRYGLIADNYHDSLIYLGGVQTASNNTNTMEIWNKTIFPYIYKTNPDFDRNFGAGIVSGQYFYLFGGNNTLLNFNYMAKINIQTGNTDKKSNFNFILSPPTNQNAATDNTNIYLFGGIQGGLLLKTIFKYDTQLDTLTLMSLQLNSPRTFSSTVYFSNNKFYVVGGINETQLLNSVEIVNPIENTIIAGPSLNFARKELMAVKYNNSIYVFGGIDGNIQPIKEIEKLDLTTGIDEVSNNVVTNFKLFNNYPNPFNPATTIGYSIPKESFVTLEIFNLLGEKITTLVNETKTPGTYNIRFEAKLNGNDLPDGIYFYRLQADNLIQSKKMILLR